MRGSIRIVLGLVMFWFAVIGMMSATEAWQWIVSAVMVLPISVLVIYSVFEEYLEK